jgi:hypothetical protein
MFVKATNCCDCRSICLGGVPTQKSKKGLRLQTSKEVECIPSVPSVCQSVIQVPSFYSTPLNGRKAKCNSAKEKLAKSR